MRKFDSSLRWQSREWLDALGKIDLLVGIPCYNSEESITHVVSMVGRGLAEHFGDRKCAILISDGGSLDDTRERAYDAKIPSSVERHVAIYRGVAGKGTAFRAVFEAAAGLRAQTVVVLDSDLRSVTPEWIRLLASPVQENRADFVAPLYRRYKYDGTITNNIVYPLTRSLFGVQIRQPIGGDYALSGALAARYAEADVWQTDVARFGIDIWMTLMAVCWDQRIAQVLLGAKIHSPKDPAADLGAMFCQVVSTLFYVAGEMSARVRDAARSRQVEIAGEISRSLPIEPVEVNLQAMDEEFLEGFEQFAPMYRRVLDPENYRRLTETQSRFRSCVSPDFPPRLWARILYDFLHVYRVWNRNRRRLVDMLVPLYFGRLAAYCREVADLEDEKEVEKLIERQAGAFEEEKPYLLERWN